MITTLLSINDLKNTIFRAFYEGCVFLILIKGIFELLHH